MNGHDTGGQPPQLSGQGVLCCCLVSVVALVTFDAAVAAAHRGTLTGYCHRKACARMHPLGLSFQLLVSQYQHNQR